MRRWTLVAALPAVVLALFVLVDPARATRVQLLRAAQQAQVRPAPPETMQVVVGDTFWLRRSERPLALMREYEPVDDATAFAVRPAILERGRGGSFRATKVGTATITGSRANQPPAEKVVRVLSDSAALTQMVMDVCPNDDEAAMRANRPAVSREVERIHEFHDCQRLIEGEAYSAAVGIFAHKIVSKAPSAFRRGAVAATILNFRTKDSTMRYASLGIEPGTSCLVMMFDQAKRWHAAIVHQSAGYTPCRTLTWENVSANRRAALVVDTVHGFDLLGRPGVPPVARWDWDARHRRNYIGIACGADVWCEIGPGGFVPSPPLQFPDPRNRRGTLAMAKGLYDQQLLADSTGSRPTTVLGTLRPGEDAKSPGSMKHRPSTPPRKYRMAVMELEETASTHSAEYVRYYKDYVDAAGMPTASRATSILTLEPRISPNSRHVYRGEFNGRPLTLDTGIVKRSHSHLHKSTPVVRWRWVVNDERTWSYCAPDGCCENIAALR